MQDEAPFNRTLTEQIARLQRQDIEKQLADNALIAQAAAAAIATIAATVSRLDERSIHSAERMTKMETVLDEVSKEVSVVKDLAARYKGGLAVILGASSFAIGVIAFWDKLVAKFHG